MDIKQWDYELEFERFVRFGGVLDTSTRRYLVAYLRQKLEPLYVPDDALKGSYMAAFSLALDDVFSSADVVGLAQSKKVLAHQIILDTLKWFKRSFARVEKDHPFIPEEQELGSWAVRHLRQLTGTWMFAIQKIEQYYPKHELDASFHRKSFEETIKNRNYEQLSENDLARVDQILTDLLGLWDARLQAKILRHQLQKLEGELNDFRQRLEGKVREFRKLEEVLSPFSQYLGKYWDMSQSLWNDVNFSVLERYEELLKDEEELRRLADLLGQMRQAEIETEELEYERIIVRKEWQHDPMLRSEITGVRTSNDLSQMLSSEAAWMDGYALEDLFLKKYADEQLITRKYQDKRLVSSNDVLTETEQSVKLREKGPFIVCVDTSGSMEGDPEEIAKVLSFGILKMASKEDRQAYLINFSSGIQTIDLYDLSKSIDAIAKFLSFSFRGGTDLSLALHEALKQLQTHQYQDADVLVISDFIMYNLEQRIVDGMHDQQYNYNTQFHSLIISDQPSDEVIAHFDNVWQYNPKQKGIVQELYRTLEGVIKD